jgi:hypothetical protein
MTSGFHRRVNDICALLGFYEAYSGSLLPMFRDILSARPQGLSRNYHSTLRKIPKERRSNVSILDCYAVCVGVSCFVIRMSGMNYTPLNANAIHFKFLQTVVITWWSRERVRRKNTIVTDCMIMKWRMVIDLKEYSFRLGNIFVECKVTRRAFV